MPAPLNKSITALASMLNERRSDIAEILEDLLNGDSLTNEEMEARLEGRTSEFRVVCSHCHRDNYVQYDTLTTLLERIENGMELTICDAVYEGEKKPEGWLE
jgi:hypothetical protein